MPKFLLELGGEVIQEIPAEDQITVGRKLDNDVVIDSPAVSGHHCRIVRTGDTYFVEDLYSTNGVFLNAKKVAKSELQNNDVIGIAKHVLRFIDDRPPLDAPVPPVAQALPLQVAQPVPLEVGTTPSQSNHEPETASNTIPKKPAMIRVLKGVVNQSEIELKNRSTFIGKSDRVQIRIKGTGLFRSGPQSAAMIAQQQTGYFLVPVKEGYVKLNGRVVHQKELLRDGDVIQAGGTTLKFEDSNGDHPPEGKSLT